MDHINREAPKKEENYKLLGNKDSNNGRGQGQVHIAQRSFNSAINLENPISSTIIYDKEQLTESQFVYWTAVVPFHLNNKWIRRPGRESCLTRDKTFHFYTFRQMIAKAGLFSFYKRILLFAYWKVQIDQSPAPQSDKCNLSWCHRAV